MAKDPVFVLLYHCHRGAELLGRRLLARPPSEHHRQPLVPLFWKSTTFGRFERITLHACVAASILVWPFCAWGGHRRLPVAVARLRWLVSVRGVAPCSRLCSWLLSHSFLASSSVASQKFRDDYSLTFSADAIHFRTAQIDSHLQWSMYSRAWSMPILTCSITAPPVTVIPKRVFQSAEQQQAFEQLLIQHISEIVRRDI